MTAYEAPPVPSQKQSPWLHCIWGPLGGLAIGAAIASGIWWLAWREREKRHQVEIISIGTGAPTEFVKSTLASAGNLLSSAGAPGDVAGLAKGRTDASPTKDEISAYLEGKTLPLPEGDKLVLNQGENSGKSLLLKKEGVEAVQKGAASNWGNEPWSTPVVFIYNSGDARYAVEATIMHKPVADQTAFFGFVVNRVARQ